MDRNTCILEETKITHGEVSSEGKEHSVTPGKNAIRKRQTENKTEFLKIKHYMVAEIKNLVEGL